MVGRLMNLMQDAYLAVGLNSSCKHSITEVLLGNNLRTAESKENSARLDSLQTLDIKACITLQGITQSTTMLGKSRWVENNKVVHFVVGVEILESILAEGSMAVVAREVHGNVLVCKLHSLGATVNRVYKLGSSTHGINRESASIAEHI